MTNPFRDQEKFMRACDQTVGEVNAGQFGLYKSLIKEEYEELIQAKSQLDELDALIDILVVNTLDGSRCRRSMERSHAYKFCQDR